MRQPPSALAPSRRPFPGLTRRRLLQAAGLGALGLPMLGRPARAGDGVASRIIFFYFPDGVAGQSQNGDPSMWHCTGGEYDFALGASLGALAPWRDHCLFFNGLSMGGTDSGSHPGGAKKLLTAADYGNNESIDQMLARTAGASSPWRHLLLGAMANENGASGDKHVSYPVAGTSLPPEDNPRRAFEALFGASGSSSSGGGSGEADPAVARRRRVLDVAHADLVDLQGQLGSVEKEKLEYHLASLEELEARLDATVPSDVASCAEPSLDTSGFADDTLYDPATFPAILRAQMDLTVLAMECGLTRVATIQASHHTSDLLMSRFPDTPMYDPSYDMRSHQASHYGAGHDWGHREFAAFAMQREWWVEQFAYLLGALDARPEGDGTMLDHSIVVLCTEVCDGNLHLHDNMPLIVAGGAGGAIRPGRLLQYGGNRHGELWIALAHAMGQGVGSFGDSAWQPLPGVLG